METDARLPANTNYGDGQQLKKTTLLKMQQHTQTKEQGGLKKYKNKLHKGSSASSLAKFMGRFCHFVCVCVFCRCPSRQSVVLFRGKKNQMIFVALLSAAKRRRSGQKHSDDASGGRSPGQTWLFG